jgi:uncharacterized membrane-anchored protein
MVIFSQPLARKVPNITPSFWLIKLLTTAMGEAASDFLVAKYNPYLAVALGGLALLLALSLQFRSRRYSPWIYWLTASMVAIFGTMAADGLHVQLGVPYIASASFFAVVLAVVFVLWFKSEGSLSIHSITTTKREVFYWLVVMATFALGTALGDLAANTLGLGYFSAGLVFLAAIAVPAAAYLITKQREIFWFWFAYILTRPLGASFADYFSKSKSVGGLGLGDGRVAIVLVIAIALVIWFVSRDKKQLRPTH